MRGACGREKGHTNHNHDGGNFYGGEKNLDGASETYAEIVDAGHAHDPEHGKRLRPGEDEIVGFDPGG